MKSVLAVAAVTLFVASSAFASIMAVDGPPVDAWISQPTHGSIDPADGWGLDLRSVTSGFRSAGQTFTAPSSTLIDKIYLSYSLESGRTNPVSITIKVWELAGSSAPAAPTSILYQETASVAYVNYDTDPAAHYMEFDIADLAVEAGHFYAFELTSPVRFGDAGFLMNTDSDSYIGGQPVRRIGTTEAATAYTSTSTGDLEFYITAVPEPATMVLLGIGAVGALIRRRK